MLNGRYGADKLGFILLFASIFFTLIAALLSPQNVVMRIILLLISAVIFAFAVFRVFSKNVKMRKRELRVLEAGLARITSLFERKDNIGEPGKTDAPTKSNDETNCELKDKDLTVHNNDSDNGGEENAQGNKKANAQDDGFKHFKCPRCKKHLKVPVGKGYIRVVCPACGHRFTKHT